MSRHNEIKKCTKPDVDFREMLQIYEHAVNPLNVNALEIPQTHAVSEHFSDVVLHEVDESAGVCYNYMELF